MTDSVDGTAEYTYDALGQLLTETVNGAVVNAMTYDNYGNILTKNGINYTYDTVWRDLLTSYDGQTITYDAQGNPTAYLGHTLTWEKGRQLKSFDSNTYTYNANGIRTSKTVAGITHTYTLDGTKILREVWGENTLVPLYDNEDSVCGIIYNDEPYYFQKNLQGDIIGIVDKNAQTVARYSYDAWGVCTVTQDTSECGIASINPFRYRGYFYDEEIGMYYLQSRYYDPETGRFVNADESENCIDVSTILDHNAFAYVQNNPLVFSDNAGENRLTDLWENVKKGTASAWNWIKKAGIKTGTSVGYFFKNIVWEKGIVNGVWDTFCKKWTWETFCKKWVWKTFCKKWVWDKFCKEMVYNTFIKKWVWQTFCKEWTWETFCKKWVWKTFCKKWVWETFCKDWIANKAWNWIKKAWDTVKQFVNNNPIIGTIVSILGVVAGAIGLFVSAPWVAISGFALAVVGLLLDIVSKY